MAVEPDGDAAPLEQRELLAEEGGPLEEDISPPAGTYNVLENERAASFGKLVLVLLAIGLILVVLGVTRRSSMKTAQSGPIHVAMSAMDRSVNPCEDFYGYACGSWLRRTKIPSDRSAYSRSFSEVHDALRVKLRTLLDEDLQKPGNRHKLAGDFYASCMSGLAEGPTDTAALARFKPAFIALKDSESFSALLAMLHSSLAAGMFSSGVGVDAKHPTKYAFYVSQGGLGLSHRDKYTSLREKDVKLREAYLKLIEDHLRVARKAELIEGKAFDDMAKAAFLFEKELAHISRPPEAMRDPEKDYNPENVTSFPKGMRMDRYLADLNLNIALIGGRVIVGNIKYITGVGKMMTRVEDDLEWRKAAKSYLAFHLLRHYAGNGILGSHLYNTNFEFKKLIYGVKKIPAKWKRCQAMTGRYVGDSLGAAFVAKHFSPVAKKTAIKLAHKITGAFDRSLDNQDWMDEATRSKAHEKLDAINWKVGYTAKFDTYPGLKISKDTFSENVLGGMRYAVDYDLGRLGKPVDKTEWSMAAYEVNAYYSPTRNEMVFPAGILQPPFFSEGHPDAMNYGAIGAVIGHEMSHGFDDQGRKYNASGTLTSWWTPESAKRYVSKTKCFIKLFDGYKPEQTKIHVLGNLTLGENLADTNGVKVSFHAFKSSSEKNSDPERMAPEAAGVAGLTNHQLFFLSFAQTWCTKYRPQALELQMRTDPHSPGKFRVLGPLSQNPEFAKTFKCKVGTPYNPRSRCALW